MSLVRFGVPSGCRLESICLILSRSRSAWWDSCGLALPSEGLNFGQCIARRGAFLLTCERLARAFENHAKDGLAAALQVSLWP